MTLPKRAPVYILFLLIALQCIVTTTFNLTHFYELKKSGLDGLLYTQLLFNSLHGNGLTTTLHAPYEPQHWFAVHFSPILYLFVPLYALFPKLQMLLAIHSAAIALGAWPLFLCAQRILQHSWQALCIAVMYLISPYIMNAGIWDFHEIAFAPFIFGMMLLAVIEQKKLPLIIYGLLLVSLKEHFGIALFGFGLLWAWHWKDYKFGAAYAAFGVAVLILVLFVIMPHFSPTGAPAMMNEHSKLDRFSWLHHPLENLRLAGVILASGFFYFAQIILPLWFLPIRTLVWLFPASADLAVNILSSNDLTRETLSYHTAAIMPVALVAFCMALKNYYGNEGKLKRIDIIIGSMAFAGFLFYTQTALPITDEGNLWEFSSPRLAYTEADKSALDAINKVVPSNAPVSAQNNVLPHLPPRYKMYQFPDAMGKADYIVLHTGFPFERQYKVLGAPYSVPGVRYFRATWKLLDSPDWGIVLYDNDWLVVKKGAATDPATLSSVKLALSQSEDHYIALLKRDPMIYQLLMEQARAADDKTF
jgi:uncharacterized membrane protein